MENEVKNEKATEQIPTKLPLMNKICNIAIIPLSLLTVVFTILFLCDIVGEIYLIFLAAVLLVQGLAAMTHPAGGKIVVIISSTGMLAAIVAFILSQVG